MPVGRFVQLPVTAGLVQLSVFPPADPETAKFPVQAVPFVAVEFQVAVPEKLLAVVVPEIVPFPWAVLHVPDTELPAWDKPMTIAVM